MEKIENPLMNLPVSEVLNYFKIEYLGLTGSHYVSDSILQCTESNGRNSFLIDNRIKKFDTIVRIIPLVGSLAKAKFCNVLGHPISKSVWTDLLILILLIGLGAYAEIFLIIMGLFKKKEFVSKKYILLLSCAKLWLETQKTVRLF
uniref:Maturase K n=1 Tax=Mammillaria columbiana TaxID=867411 RepID=H1ZUS2_9CARY|nr:maturase K [Mammillaria columbiana]